MRLLALLLACSCGAPAHPCDRPLPVLPQLCPDRESLGFQAENAGSGTVLGRQRFESLGIRNGGRELLRIASATIEGEGFSILEEPPPTIESDVDAFLVVAFMPPDAGLYAGTLHVASNAQNAPSRDFALSACGVRADAGTTSCPFP